MSTKKRFKRLHKNIEKIILGASTKTMIEYKKSLDKLRNTVRQYYDKYPNSNIYDELNKYNRMKKFDSDIRSSLFSLYDTNKKITNDTLVNVFNQTRDATLGIMAVAVTSKLGSSFSNSITGIKKTLDVDKTVNSNMKGLHWSERYNHHRDNVVYEVNKTLKEGLSQGETYSQMSERLSDSLNKDVLNPTRIIRTEGSRVYAQTQKDVLDNISEKGVGMVKTWNTVRDERVRGRKLKDAANHFDMDGQEVKYEEEFTLPDGLKTMYPHMVGVARHDINCRCFITIDLPDEDNNLSSPTLYNEGEENINPEIKNAENYLSNAKNELNSILSSKVNESSHASNLQTYLAYSEFVPDQSVNTAFKYDVNDDIILYNYTHPDFSSYDMNYALAHELSHRIDLLYYKSYENEKFLQAIKNSESILYENIEKWFEEGGMFESDVGLSDMISGLSKSKLNNILIAGHKEEYWLKNDINLPAEVFANLSAMDVLDTQSKKEIMSMFSELFDAYREVIYEYY